MAEIITDRIDCAASCTIPAGVRLAEVPRPRHAWGDVSGCPNDGCDRWFMILPPEEPDRG